MTMNEYLTKYPWLRGYDPYPDETDTEPCNILEWLPRGWVEAFGEEMCEDLDKAIKAAGLESEFRIDEAKEKYGMMRLYYYPSTPEIDDIVHAYEQISETVCVHCGAIEGVKFVNVGWCSPYCRRCYGKIHRTTDFAKFDALPDEELPTVVKWSRYSKNGKEHFELDISETTRKIRERYEKRKASGEFEEDVFDEWEDRYNGA